MPPCLLASALILAGVGNTSLPSDDGLPQQCYCFFDSPTLTVAVNTPPGTGIVLDVEPVESTSSQCDANCNPHDDGLGSCSYEFGSAGLFIDDNGDGVYTAGVDRQNIKHDFTMTASCGHWAKKQIGGLGMGFLCEDCSDPNQN